MLSVSSITRVRAVPLSFVRHTVRACARACVGVSGYRSYMHALLRMSAYYTRHIILTTRMSPLTTHVTSSYMHALLRMSAQVQRAGDSTIAC